MKSRVLVTVIFFGLLAAPLFGQAAKPAPKAPAASQKAKAAGMTNADVLELVGAGFSDDLVVARIKGAAEKSFDLSTTSLVALKKAGVSERVISAMMGVEPTPSLPPSVPTSSAPPSRVEVALNRAPTQSAEGREAGIYLEEDGNMVMLEPTVFMGGKTGSVVASAFTYGLKKAKWKALVRSPRANQRVKSSQPVFYFYFENKGSGLSNTGAFSFGGNSASSPNEFVLVKMTAKKNERELIVGESGLTGMTSGTRSKDTLPLDIVKIQPGVYKVTVTEPLPPGEYCFYHAAGSSAMMSAGTGKLFDFGYDGGAVAKR